MEESTDFITLVMLFDELLYAIGKLALEEGEAWRLTHVELMDTYQACEEFQRTIDNL